MTPTARVLTGLTHDDFTSGPREHEATTFRDCELTEVDLGARRFVDCTFERCNLTSAEWRGVSLNNVTFNACKLLGANLTGLRKTLLTVAFTDCKLDYVDFGGLDLAKTRFVRCSLIDATFVGTDLTGASFQSCDVSGALFRNTNLTGADLRGADGLVLDPDANRIQKARISTYGLAGLLTKYKLDID